VFIATQYYRPPFPHRRYWQDDLSRMRDAGLSAVQFWAVWGWIEPEPGVYRFEDYDELVAEADKRGLGVILSTIAEIHPFWIHRVVPGSEMVDHMGHKVISTLRREMNQGLTPGGCTDNPAVRERMAQFLHTIGARYAGAANLIGWDCWNETRWAVNADGHVCYCEHTLAAFRRWLDKRYGGLEGLNAAWQRRYCSWDDVFPGKVPGRVYSEMIDFTRFLTWRAREHAHFRYQALHAEDPKHLISAHCATPATLSWGLDYEQALSRGNDWELADELDGFGCSHFPFWQPKDRALGDAGFGVRVESIRSAAGPGKTMWVSELQGGSARGGFTVFPSVAAQPQQRWVWNGYARGAKGVIFWCWRDELFGRESSGFGLTGHDGLAEERIAALKKTGDLLQRHNDLLDAYQPDEPAVGALFIPDNYHLAWAQDGTAALAGEALAGYLLALERLSVPYRVVSTTHLDRLQGIKVLILPWPLIVPEAAARRLQQFVEEGGTLICETEIDAFSQPGFYREPGPDRPFASTLGIRDGGRRLPPEGKVDVAVDGRTYSLQPGTWVSPLDAEGATVLAYMEGRQPLATHRKVGRGEVFALGTFFGQPYYQQRNYDFESWLRALLRHAGAEPAIVVQALDVGENVQWRSGLSNGERLLFLINPGPARLVRIEMPRNLPGALPDLLSLADGAWHKAEIVNGCYRWVVPVDEGGYAILHLRTK